jgi:hypothetical protein
VPAVLDADPSVARLVRDAARWWLVRLVFAAGLLRGSELVEAAATVKAQAVASSSADTRTIAAAGRRRGAGAVVGCSAVAAECVSACPRGDVVARWPLWLGLQSGSAAGLPAFA